MPQTSADGSTPRRAREDRLREHPAQRFASPIRRIDIEEEFEKLVNEPHDSVSGHRQIAIDHKGSMTTILFAFEEGATLPEHNVEGPVHIQVVEGRLDVRADEENHQLEAGEILMLNPGVPHDVTAPEEARAVVTVNLSQEAKYGDTDESGEEV